MGLWHILLRQQACQYREIQSTYELDGLRQQLLKNRNSDHGENILIKQTFNFFFRVCISDLRSLINFTFSSWKDKAQIAWDTVSTYKRVCATCLGKQGVRSALRLYPLAEKLGNFLQLYRCVLRARDYFRSGYLGPGILNEVWLTRGIEAQRAST